MAPAGSFEHVSARVRQISVSPTIAMSGRAAALKAQGRPVISLSLGELDFNTPGPIIAAAHRAALNGETRYTAPDGRASLKRAVQHKFSSENGLDYTLEELHVASGCKQVIHNALAATLDPGDEVVVFTPYWVSYTDLVSFCGGKPVVVPTTAESGFLPDPDALAAALTPRTRWVILNSPNNPSGAVYNLDLQARLGAVIAAHPQALVMSDEIYEHLIFDGNHHVPFLTAAPDLRNRTLTVNGVSKAYAMTGWRIGYGAGPTWLIGAMAKVQSQTAGNTSSISQAAAEAALLGDQSALPEWRRVLQERRDSVLSVLQQSNRIAAVRPSGAFYVYADVGACLGRQTPSGAVLGNDVDVANYLLESADVATVAGEAFGLSPFIRLSFAAETEVAAEAARRIVNALEKLGPTVGEQTS